MRVFVFFVLLGSVVLIRGFWNHSLKVKSNEIDEGLEFCRKISLHDEEEGIRYSKFISGFIEPLQKQEVLNNFIQDYENWDKYIWAYSYSAFAIAAIIVCGFLLWIHLCGVACCNNRFICCCPLQIKYYPRTSRFISISTFLMCSIVVLAFVIYALSNIRDLENACNDGECSIIEGINEIKAGVQTKTGSKQTNGWEGLSEAIIKLHEIDGNLTSTAEMFRSFCESYPYDLINRSAELTNLINNIYIANKDIEVNDPSAQENDGNVVPNFIKNLGPSRTDCTYTNDLLKEKEKLDVVLLAMTGIYSISEDILSNLPTVHETISKSILSLNNIMTEVHQYQYNISSVLINKVHPVVNTVFFSCYSIFITLCCFSVLALLPFAPQLFNKNTHPCCVHLSWNLQFIVLIICIIRIALFCCLVFFPFSILLTDACEIMHDKMKPETFRNMTEYFSPEVITVIERCMFENGDLSEEFDIGYYLKFAIEMNDNFKEIIHHADSLSYTYPVVTNLTNVVARISFNPINEVYDAKSSIKQLNQWTSSLTQKTKVSECTKLKDFWVYNQSMCTSYPYQTYSENPELGKKNCLVISEWRFTEVINRYEQARMGCPIHQADEVAGEIRQRFSEISKYDLQLRNYYYSSKSSIYHEFENLHGQLTNTGVLMQKELPKIGSLSTQTSALINLIQYDFLNQLNCSFVRNSYERGNAAICNALNANISYVLMSIFLIVFFSIFSIYYGVAFHAKMKSNVYHQNKLIQNQNTPKS